MRFLLFVVILGFLMSLAACVPVGNTELSPVKADTKGSVKSVRVPSASAHIKEFIKTVKIPYDFGNSTIMDNATSFGTLKCETSWASPTYTEIDYMTKYLDMSWPWEICAQTNPGGSGCTTHAKRFGGALALCGTAPWSVKCHELAWAGRQIKKGCGDNNKQRAGGYYVFDEYLKAALY